MNFIYKLWSFPILSILGFLYDGYEAWVSIIQGIRERMNRRR